MEPAKATFRPREGFIPNPKLPLRGQVQEVMRFKQFSLRTERVYWGLEEAILDVSQGKS